MLCRATTQNRRVARISSIGCLDGERVEPGSRVDGLQGVLHAGQHGAVPAVPAFADFATGYGVGRADGNKKGVFIRDRRPKAAAFALRRRWTKRRTD